MWTVPKPHTNMDTILLHVCLAHIHAYKLCFCFGGTCLCDLNILSSNKGVELMITFSSQNLMCALCRQLLMKLSRHSETGRNHRTHLFLLRHWEVYFKTTTIKKVQILKVYIDFESTTWPRIEKSKYTL